MRGGSDTSPKKGLFPFWICPTSHRGWLFWALRAVGRNSCKCLGMDGNGHSPVWGPATESPNPQGILLENLLAREDLVCLNSSESPPTYTGDNNICSWIDVTAASMDLIEHIWKWQVVDDAHLGSDHALITWELGVKEYTPIVRKMYNWQQLDWTRFRHRLKSAMIPFSEPLLSTPSQLDSVISRFTTMMQKLVREHVPLRQSAISHENGGHQKLNNYVA